MSEVNKHDGLIINHYTNNYIEDDRFINKGKRLEFITTMHYIQKYAPKNCKILEIGAATGAYSIELAKMGYEVDKKAIVIDSPIKRAGVYEIGLKLYKGVTGKLKVNVKAK